MSYQPLFSNTYAVTPGIGHRVTRRMSGQMSGYRSPANSDIPTEIPAKPDPAIFKAVALAVLRQEKAALTITDLTLKVLEYGTSCPVGKVWVSSCLVLDTDIAHGVNLSCCGSQMPEHTLAYALYGDMDSGSSLFRLEPDGTPYDSQMDYCDCVQDVYSVYLTTGKFGLHEWGLH